MAGKSKKYFGCIPDDIPLHWKLDVTDLLHVATVKTAPEKKLEQPLATSVATRVGFDQNGRG